MSTQLKIPTEILDIQSSEARSQNNFTEEILFYKVTEKEFRICQNSLLHDGYCTFNTIFTPLFSHHLHEMVLKNDSSINSLLMDLINSNTFGYIIDRICQSKKDVEIFLFLKKDQSFCIVKHKFVDIERVKKTVLPVDGNVLESWRVACEKGDGEEWIKYNPNIKYFLYNNNTTNDDTIDYVEILDTNDWESWLNKYVDHTIRKGEYELVIDEIRDTNILEFPLFTQKFCQELITLAKSKNKWTVDRHTFYPTTDILLRDIGLDQAYNRVIKEIVQPLVVYWWNLEGIGWQHIESENFLVKYTSNKQSHLSLHHDNSHISIIVKLNDEFDGGGTWFPKYKVLSNPRRIGTATLHPGMVTHRHGARPITSGERYITVSFVKKA